MVFRIHVEKKPGFDVKAKQLFMLFTHVLSVKGLNHVRVINRYDVEGISHEVFEQSIPTVFGQPPTDTTSENQPAVDELGRHARLFAVESLPGQFDQRADSAAQCIQLITQGLRPQVRTATLYLLEGEISLSDLKAIKNFLINPVDSREADLSKPDSLESESPEPENPPTVDGFNSLSDRDLLEFIERESFAMDLADAKLCQQYFQQEGRDPTQSELRVIDTYWSDHCRHTTFETHLEQVRIDDQAVQNAFDRYMSIRAKLGRQGKPVCLMDMATIGAKYLEATGELKGLDHSKEINACTVKTTVDVNGQDQDWLFLFKNETHNHPTEIEPFGGAATCIGGAIRDPLSGRSYVYQAMRVTGAADPRRPIDQTLPGKLPQRRIVTSAAEGYSSYGNQIGLATGQVHEIYHPGYVAKRLEVGAVVGATAADHVRRQDPRPGDPVILVGGRTGRDGIGGATGSSKSQSAESVEKSGAEVQKGNAPEERRLQRLFRRKDACRLIKRCNDFGAGGVAVATGELADGLSINLDRVPLKYQGLDGTEIAISESQERMAVTVAPEDADTFIAYARQENLEATVIALITQKRRLTMAWKGRTIVDLSRDFLASNGAPKHAQVHVSQVKASMTSCQEYGPGSLSLRMRRLVSDINLCSNKGLAERFDSTIGSATILMPFGGKRQLTQIQSMVCKLPVDGQTHTVSAMAWGFNPYISEMDPFTGAYLAVVESVSKLVATGFSRTQAYLSLQEYFQRLREDPDRWGKPVAAVLGALQAQLDLSVGAIGGKDSMSGSFENLDVPPTLISFAVALGKVEQVISPEFKQPGDSLLWISPDYENRGLRPEGQSLRNVLDYVQTLSQSSHVAAMATPGYGCAAHAMVEMALGNAIGASIESTVDVNSLFTFAYGSFLVEADPGYQPPSPTQGVTIQHLGRTIGDYVLSHGSESVDLHELEEVWASGLEDIFPYRGSGPEVKIISYEQPVRHEGQSDNQHGRFGKCQETQRHDFDSVDGSGFNLPGAITHQRSASSRHWSKPVVTIPVFPGTNCEYDSARAFRMAGAEVHTLVVNNMSARDVSASSHALAQAIDSSQIIMLPGGFSGGDEPDGSAKLIASFFRSARVSDAVQDLLENRDGLMLGICNGFQALMKLGLLPYGSISLIGEDSPTLTFNDIGRHQSRLVRTRISSTLSPWMAEFQTGDIHTMPISHGEGRFVANKGTLQTMIDHGQICAQYVDQHGQPSMDVEVNPNGSVLAIEAVCSPDGRVLGKMGHSERSLPDLYRNVPHLHPQPLFQAGVDYFAH